MSQALILSLTEVDILITSDMVVTSAEGPIFTPGYVAISGSEIYETGPDEPHGLTAQRKLKAGNSIVMPGLISAHDHMYGILAHGILVRYSPTSFWDFLNNFWWPYVEDRLDRDTVAAAVEMSAAQRLKTGTTCVADVLEAPNTLPGVLESEAVVIEKAGLRAVLSFEATERVSQENGVKGLAENLAFVRARNRAHGIIKGMHCIHTTFTCSPEFIRQCREEADETGAGIHIHFEEGIFETQESLRKYGKYPAEVYEELGFWKDDVLASQCVKTTEMEIGILARHGVRVSHQPLSNGEVGGGVAPVPLMLEKEMTVCLGTDGFIIDMFEVMRNTWLLHKAAREDASIMPAKTVFKMATENGASTLGIRAGRLEKGYKADVIVVRNDFPTPVTPENVITQLVVYASGQQVETVLVNGKVVVEGGRVITVDEDKAREKCMRAAAKLWRGVA